MRWLPSSLSSRLLAVFLLTAFAAVVLMASLFSRGLGSQWRSAIVPHLFQYVSYIQNDLGVPPSEDRARALVKHLPIQIQSHDRRTGKILFSTRQRALQTERLRFKPLPRWRFAADQSAQGSSIPSLTDITIADNKRQIVLRLNQGDFHVYLEFERPRSRDSGISELILALAGVAALLALCYLSIRQLLKPIGKLQTTVQKISDGDLSARANATGSDDLAVLAHSVDRMSKRIQQMLDAKRELLLAISHELRSPLTRARVAAEMLEPSRYQHKLTADIDEMETLIAQLVESERLQSHVVLDLHDVDVSRILSETVSAFDAQIDWQAPHAPIIITADATRLQVLFKNVIGNALRHGKHHSNDEADVSVKLQQNQKEVCIVVTDQGPGVNTEQLAKIGEPFYRTDESRTRKTGGIGLGLYLSKRTAEAHGGSLEIENQNQNQSDTGLQVTIRLRRTQH